MVNLIPGACYHTLTLQEKFFNTFLLLNIVFLESGSQNFVFIVSYIIKKPI